MSLSREAIVSAGVLGSYLVLYSGYDKKSGSLKLDMITKILGFSNVTFSCREINKILALGGLTVIGLSFAAPQLGAGSTATLQEHAAGLLLVHGLYSTGSFYGWSPVKKYLNNKRNVAILMGDAAVALLATEALAGESSLSAVQNVSKENLLAASLFLGTCHFYFMEVVPGPYMGKLKVRPYGFLAFGTSAIGLGLLGKAFFAPA